MKFKTYLNEKFYKRYNNIEIFINPTPDESRYIIQQSKNKCIRFSAVHKEKNVYIFNGDYLHYQVYELSLNNKFSIKHNVVLNGTAELIHNKIQMSEYDVIDECFRSISDFKECVDQYIRIFGNIDILNDYIKILDANWKWAEEYILGITKFMTPYRRILKIIKERNLNKWD